MVAKGVEGDNPDAASLPFGDTKNVGGGATTPPTMASAWLNAAALHKIGAAHKINEDRAASIQTLGAVGNIVRKPQKVHCFGLTVIVSCMGVGVLLLIAAEYEA